MITTSAMATRNLLFSGEACSFKAFCSQCLATRWEVLRFIAVDGEVEPVTKFSATGLEPKLPQLFENGRTIKPRSIVYDFDLVGSPFYETRQHVLARPQKEI